MNERFFHPKKERCFCSKNCNFIEELDDNFAFEQFLLQEFYSEVRHVNKYGLEPDAKVVIAHMNYSI